MILLTLLIAVLLFLVLGLFRTHSTANKLAGLSWEELIAKLEPVETEAITTVAVEYLNPGKSQAWLGPDEMWNMIGRADGLARMRANADVLIAIAAHAQRWNPAEGVIVAEQMRQDGLALRRAVVGIGLGMTCGYGKVRVPNYVREAAGTYYLMRQRLLALHEASQPWRYASLAAVL
jgi:hypothetical protein